MYVFPSLQISATCFHPVSAYMPPLLASMAKEFKVHKSVVFITIYLSAIAPMLNTKNVEIPPFVRQIHKQ